MQACEKLNLDITNIYPVILGKTGAAKTAFHEKHGHHISELSKYSDRFIIESGLYDEMNRDDQYFTRNFGKYTKESHLYPSMNLNEAYVDIHYPNGIMRLYFEHGRHALFFKDPNYGKNLQKPKDPGPCTSGCDNGIFYSFGTSYPCSHCMEIQRYKLKLKDAEIA